jgi:riboflavin biosynthesis pyrimidine reductase
LSEYNLRVVVSGSGTLDAKAEIFKHRFSPIVVLVSERISGRNLRKLQSLADEVKVCGRNEVDFVKALRLAPRKMEGETAPVRRRRRAQRSALSRRRGR